MGVKATNNATTTTAAAVSSTDLSLTVASGTGSLFPTLGASDYFYATLSDTSGNYEIVKVTARVGDVMTVVRSQEGTLAIPFPTNSRFEIRVTAASLLESFVSNYDFLLL